MRRMFSEKQIAEIAQKLGVNKIQSNNIEEINELFKFEASDSENLQITFKTSKPEEYVGIMSIHSILGDDTNAYLILDDEIFTLAENIDNIAPVSSSVADGFQITDTTGQESFGEAGIKTYEELYDSDLCVVSLVLL